MHPFPPLISTNKRLFTPKGVVTNICHNIDNAPEPSLVLTTVAEDLTAVHYFPHSPEVWAGNSRNLPFLLHHFWKSRLLVTLSANSPFAAFEGTVVNTRRQLLGNSNRTHRFGWVPCQDTNLVSLKRILHFTGKIFPCPKLRMKMLQKQFCNGK